MAATEGNAAKVVEPVVVVPEAAVLPVRRVNRELASIGVKMDKEAQMPAELLGPTRTMTLKGAKTAAA